MRHLILCLIAVLLLHGCGPGRPVAQEDMQAILKAVGPWEQGDDGYLVHRPTRTAFPAVVAGFARDKYTAFRVDGSDVAVDYKGAGDAKVTVYLTYHDGITLGAEYVLAREAVALLHEGTTEAAGAHSPFAGSDTENVRSALFSLADGRLTGLWLRRGGMWTSKIRVTAARAQWDASAAVVEALIREIRWPGRIGKEAVPCEPHMIPLVDLHKPEVLEAAEILVTAPLALAGLTAQVFAPPAESDGCLLLRMAVGDHLLDVWRVDRLAKGRDGMRNGMSGKKVPASDDAGSETGPRPRYLVTDEGGDARYLVLESPMLGFLFDTPQTVTLLVVKVERGLKLYGPFSGPLPLSVVLPLASAVYESRIAPFGGLAEHDGKLEIELDPGRLGVPDKNTAGDTG